MLLLGLSALGWAGALALEGEVHALVATILLGRRGLDQVGEDAEADPPDGEGREPTERLGGKVPVQPFATGGDDLPDTATALGAIPAVVRADIRRQVGEHLASQTQMDSRERKYWDSMYEKLR